MSIDEQVALLESEKQSYLRQHEERLASLKRSRSEAAERDEEAPPIHPGSRFRPIPNSGLPASEMIIQERG